MTDPRQAEHKQPWFKCYIGPDYYRCRGWKAWLMFLPARELMTYREQGRYILCALSVEIQTRPEFPWLSVKHYSDVDEITRRRAGDFSRAL